MKFKTGSLYEVTDKGIDVDDSVEFGTQTLSIGDIFLCLDFKPSNNPDLQDYVALTVLFNGKKFVRSYHPYSWFAEILENRTKELK